TRDDAAGEAFDKVAKLLGLPYPGGPHIERLAMGQDTVPNRFRFTRPMLRSNQRPGDPDYYDVSFSGLKTAVLTTVRASDDLERDRADIARGFQDALIDTLVEKTSRAVAAFERTRVVLGGGVACNRTLVAATRHRQRGHDRARRPVPRRTRRLVTPRPRCSRVRASTWIDRDMIVHHPFAYSIGWFSFTGFGIAVLLAFVIAQIISQRELARRGHNPEPIADLIFAAVFGGLAGAKIYYF